MHTKTNHKRPRAGRPRGIALVIVLCFVVLLTVAVVAYFSRTLSTRQVADESYNSGKTDQLARSALDVVVSDFKQEIVNGSTATTLTVGTNSVTTYYPVDPATNGSSGVNTLLRANMLPQRSGNPGTPPFTASNPDPIPNLIRISNHNDATVTPSTTAPMVGSRASNVASTAPSVNGRIVSLPRWNKHFLIPQNDATGSNPAPVTTFTAPDWVMMTQEEGPVALQSPTKDASGNTVTVTGRYAYAVYDEGGLLDANVAGFPSGATPMTTGGTTTLPVPQLGYKTSLAMADLPTALANATPAITLSPTGAVDKLVGWRNYATTQPSGTFPNSSFASNFAANTALATTYFTALQTNYSGFTRTSNAYWNGSTDQAFLSRQQLIAFQQATASSFPASALQYFGTFSRELNAPSWGPSYNASEVGGTASFPYRSVRDLTSSYNRLLPGVRFTKLTGGAGTVTGYHVDGTTYTYAVKNGDPLVQRRFPLGRLAWIGPNGPTAGGTAASIQACFGLIWGPSTDPGLRAANTSVNDWQYVGPTGTAPTSTIKTLANVALEATPREPNFFELLQEGMLHYSIAQDPNPLGTPPGTDTSYAFDTAAADWTELQIFRVGASIITQSQQSLQSDGTYATTYPTVIEYTRGGNEVLAVGTDDLPYVNTMTVVGGQNTPTSCGIYMLFGLWNPHQSASTQNGTNLPRPPVRLCVTGQAVVFNYYGTNYYGPAAVTNPADNIKYPGYVGNISTGTDGLTGIQTIQLASGTNGIGGNGFVDPHVLTTADMQTAPGAGGAAGGSWATVPAPTVPLPALPAPYGAGAQYVGFRLPDFQYDPTLVATYPLPPLGTAPNQYTTPYWGTIGFGVENGNVPFNCWMEFQNPAGKWIPYSYFAGGRHDVTQLNKSLGFYAVCMGPGYKGSAGPPDTRTGDVAHPYPIEPASTPPYDAQYYLHYFFFSSDPTTIRTCVSFGQSPSSPPQSTAFWRTALWSSGTETIYPAWTDNGRLGTQGTTQLFGGVLSTWAPAGLARNNTTGASPMGQTSGHDASGNPLDPPLALYTDLDGVQRIGDSGLYPATAAPRSNAWQGDPYAASTDRMSDRPIVLHRAYTNVADLGYVSRDLAWKTLDFFSAKSADAGLLDLFTVSQNSQPFGAGRINLNTRNLPALTAMLSGSNDNVLAQPLLTALSKPADIAAKLLALTTSTATGGGPLIGKDELATRFVSTLSTTFPYASSSSDFGSSDEQSLKTRREEVTRALAEAGQVRTWNLLIDIVAQSGKYAPNATTLSAFTVEGERHYWLHVAIDRFTGQVIDEQLEAVTE